VGIQILELAELPTRALTQLASLDWSINDPPFDRSALRKAEALGVQYAPFRALFAVRDGQLLARVTVIRRQFRSSQGLTDFSGVTDVVTRPDGMGHGLARRLIRVAHERERRSGIRLALLWTQRSWGAHRIYEKLAYRDIYSPPFALKRIGRGLGSRLPSGYSLRTATRQDAPLLEALFQRSTRGRIGFVPRPPGGLRSRFAMGWRNPSDHRLLLHGDRPVGYLFGTRGPRHVSVTEGVATSAEHLRPLLDGAQKLAAGRWLVFGSTTLVRDLAPILKERGFDLYATSHATLMARPLRPGAATGWASLERTVVDPRFSCQRADIF
jgi:GNAT superfamily N-acetyltransferase